MVPSQWPPPQLVDRDPILPAGSPGAWRKQVGWNTLDVPGTTKPALIHHLREDEFVCQLDPACFDRAATDPADEPLARDELPGMSGGPRWTLTSAGSSSRGSPWVVTIGFCYFARLDRVREDGTIRAE